MDTRQNKQANKTGYKWDIEGLRKLALKIKRNEEQEEKTKNNANRNFSTRK